MDGTSYLLLDIMQGIYKHIASGKLYNVLGLARLVDDPHQNVVVYKQLYESVLRGTNTKLPVGTLWVRELKEFEMKFKRDGSRI